MCIRGGHPQWHKPPTFKNMKFSLEITELSLKVNKDFCKKGKIYTRERLPGFKWNLGDYDNIFQAKDFDKDPHGKDGKLIHGTSNDDVIFGSDLGDEIYSSDGTDNVSNPESKNLIFAGGGNDVVQGDGGDDEIYGENGDDIISGGYGNDLLYGGNDGDVINGDGGNDEMFGGKGVDRLFGGAGNDKINGGSGDDIISAERDSDVLIGGGGKDKFYVAFERNEDGQFMAHRIEDLEPGEAVELLQRVEVDLQGLDIKPHDHGAQLISGTQTLLIFEGINQQNLSFEDQKITFIQ